MTTTTRRALLGATAAALPVVAALPAVALEPLGNEPRLDWAKVRERIALAGRTLDIPATEVSALLALSDDTLNESRELLHFAQRHELSLDWLLRDGVFWPTTLGVAALTIGGAA